MPSTSTKRTIVNMAYEEASLSGYEFDITPEEQVSALRRLDALMAEWRAQSINLAYNFPATFGAGGLDDPSGIPDSAVNVAAMQLAIRIFPMFGKRTSAETRYALAQGLNALRASTAFIPALNLPRGTPLGQGNRYSTLWQPAALDDQTPQNPTLAALTLTLAACVGTAGLNTIILGNTPGSILTLTQSGALYSLTNAVTNVWNLVRIASPKVTPTETVIVIETLGGAFGSPNPALLTVAIS